MKDRVRVDRHCRWTLVESDKIKLLYFYHDMYSSDIDGRKVAVEK